MNVEEWISKISNAYDSVGFEFAQEKKDFLLSPFKKHVVESKIDIVSEAINVMTRCFFRKALTGETFGPLNRIKEQFGQSLEENYGLTSGPFLNLAKTYWTYKIEVGDLFLQNSNLVLYKILEEIDMNIASVCFPTPGPYQIPIDQRKEAQRKILHEYASEIDVNALLENNPILGTRTTFIDSPLFKRLVPATWGIIYIIIALILGLLFGLNIFTIVIGGILLYLAYKSLRVSILGSQKLIDEMLSEGPTSKGSEEEYQKL